jgi:hypothetical protein
MWRRYENIKIKHRNSGKFTQNKWDIREIVDNFKWPNYIYSNLSAQRQGTGIEKHLWWKKGWKFSKSDKTANLQIQESQIQEAWRQLQSQRTKIQLFRTSHKHKTLKSFTLRTSIYLSSIYLSSIFHLLPKLNKRITMCLLKVFKGFE